MEINHKNLTVVEALKTIYSDKFRSYEEYYCSETDKTSIFYRFIQLKFDELVSVVSRIKEEEIEMMLVGVDDSFNGNKSNKRFSNFIRCLCDGYLSILRECYNSNHCRALWLLERYIGALPSKRSVLPCLKRYISDYLINFSQFRLVKDKVYYRLRDENKENTIDNCWHTPYFIRQKSYDGRFSKSGFPCFYLAEAIETSSKELGEIEKGKNRWVGEFVINKTIGNHKRPLVCIDLCVPLENQIEQTNDYDRFCMFLNFPLILLCTTSTGNKSDSFAEEYLFSQTLMEVLSNPSDEESGICGFKGIRYDSTKHKGGVNYVFPAPSESIPPTQDERYSSRLEKIFSQKSIYPLAEDQTASQKVD